jgi:hypothetical protein
MHTAILTAALIALAPAAPASASWESSYTHAQRHAAAQKKPLVVVFGSGGNGWTNVVSSGTPAREVNKLLAEKYVCLYVDTNSAAGQKLAQDFEIADGVGMVISDRSGESQAFWHNGDMTNGNLEHYLTKYANPDVVVGRTETYNTQRTSYYPQAPAYQSVPAYYSAPAYQSAPIYRSGGC